MNNTFNTWVTSDLHFGHANILKFNPATRQFRDVEHMNESMIHMWNAVVQPNDLVYILGDVAFTNPKKATEIVSRLMGRKVLIEGNHDRKLLKDAAFRACFESVHQYLTVKYKDYRIAMFHYPIHEWDQCHRGAIHLHGHVHGKKTGLEHYRVRDAGLDAHGKIVISLDEICADAARGEIKVHGDGEKME
jgi:calcineurin-like phosphoesterase family protein